MLKIKKML